MATATMAKPMEQPQVEVQAHAHPMHWAVSVMEGVTFSTLLILFSYLYVVIAQSTFIGS